jgi:hypothetical protein
VTSRDSAPSSLDPHAATSADGVDSLARALFGDEVATPAGILHASAVADEDGAHRVIRIGAFSPPSELDLFVLNLARARADAILVSGAVLRDEPELRYELGGPGESARGLAAWRRERAGLDAPPHLLVLTRGAISLAHPAFHGWARPRVLTTREAAASLGAREGVPVVGVDAPSVRGAVAHLAEECGARSILLEAGPSATAELYAPGDCPVRELWLSVFEGTLDPRARGGTLPRGPELEAAGLVRRSVTRAPQASGPWRFERWTRRAPS